MTRKCSSQNCKQPWTTTPLWFAQCVPLNCSCPSRGLANFTGKNFWSLCCPSNQLANVVSPTENFTFSVLPIIHRRHRCWSQPFLWLWKHVNALSSTTIQLVHCLGQVKGGTQLLEEWLIRRIRTFYTFFFKMCVWQPYHHHEPTKRPPEDYEMTSSLVDFSLQSAGIIFQFSASRRYWEPSHQHPASPNRLTMALTWFLPQMQVLKSQKKSCQLMSIRPLLEGSSHLVLA